MGRGRTTTGMVITSLLLLQLNGILDRAITDMDTADDGAEAIASDGVSPAEPAWFKEGMERSLQSQVHLPLEFSLQPSLPDST